MENFTSPSPSPSSIQDFVDYRDYLKFELSEGLRSNPSYSLRAFARKCGVSPSYMSRLLSGQRRLSVSHAGRIAQGLKLNPDERGHLLALLDHSPARMSDSPLEKVSRVVEMESFQLIADWHHFAILALTKTRQFKVDPNWVAGRLGINVNSAKMALDRLMDLRFLVKVDGRWVAQDNGHIETPHDVASLAVRENHRQHLQLAARSLDDVELPLREFANASISMSVGDLPLAKKRMRAFLDKFIRDFEKDDGEEVMQLNLQLHPLSRTERKRK